MQPLHIAILGCRGIPNQYGGFEECAEHIGTYLARKGHRTVVYNSSNHPYRNGEWKGVEIVHCNDPENALGTAGQFIYDLNCILHARKQRYDVIIQVGYTSSSLWYFLWPKKTAHIVNMDGLEHLRTKYGTLVRKYLRLAEKMATWRSKRLIGDNPAIVDLLRKSYKLPVSYIPYGAFIENEIGDSHLRAWKLQPLGYDLLIARIEPENHIEDIFQASRASENGRPLVAVGNWGTKLGKRLQRLYNTGNFIFIEGVYDKIALNQLRTHARYYFHGHSVGGTNPSLLEAMACGCCIVAHDNAFNRNVCGDDALYFSCWQELTKILDTEEGLGQRSLWGRKNKEKIRQQYSWEAVAEAYEKCCYEVVGG